MHNFVECELYVNDELVDSCGGFYGVDFWTNGMYHNIDDEYTEVLHEELVKEFGEKIKDLPKEDRELLGDYIIGGLGDGVKKIKGTTVGEAIEAQRQYNAKKKQEEDQQKAKEAKAKVEEVKKGLKDGTFHIWKGPITSQDGKELVAADAVADDAFLKGVNFYVKGVEGKVPGGDAK